MNAAGSQVCSSVALPSAASEGRTERPGSEVDFLRALVDASREAIAVVGIEGTFRYASPAMEHLLSMDLDQTLLQAEIRRMTASGGRRSHVVVRIAERDAPPRLVRLDLTDETANEHLQGIVVVASGVDEAMAAEAELRQVREAEAIVARISGRFANSSLDETERDLRVSLRELCEFGDIQRTMIWSLDDLQRMLVPIDEQHRDGVDAVDEKTPNLPLAFLRSIAPRLVEGTTVEATQDNEHAALIRAIEVPGADQVHKVTFIPMRVSGGLTGLLTLNGPTDGYDWPQHTLANLRTIAEVFANALARRGAERALSHQALHDPLTGLPNRSLLLDRLGHALARSSRNGQNVTVMLIDLDGFKDVNDTLGHAAGDELLKTVSHRLLDTLRDSDSVARLGGDEFVVVAETATDELNAKMIAGRILENLRAPIDVGGQSVTVTGSLGMVLANASLDHTLDPGTLLRKADIAMYRAKTGGRDRIEIFSEEMEDRIRRRFELLDELRRAVDQGELIAWYQPIIDVATGRLSSFEALVRWMHPTRGIIPPLDFIELAEGSGLVHDLGRQVLDQAVHQLTHWRSIGEVSDSITISVNVSVRQLLSFSFVDVVRETLERHRLPAHLLHLELTESVFADRHLVTGPLLRLRDLGVRVSIDDFGTGYSSLSYLRDLPIDCLKIDRSFIQGLGTDRRDNALVGAVVGMANELGLQVVAEGVETMEQLAQLERLGCNLAQGFLFGRPEPALHAFPAGEVSAADGPPSNQRGAPAPVT